MALRSYGRIVILLPLTLLLLPNIVWGQEAPGFVPLVGIPYIEGGTVTSFGDYVNAFYYAAISIAAFLAVVRIIFAGVKYMLTDIVTAKGDAKKDIRSALFGLLIVVGAVLILNTINTNLTDIRLFSSAPSPTMVGNPGDVTPVTRPTQLGDRLLLCEGDYNQAEVANFRSQCPGHVNATVDGSTGCAVLICAEEATSVAELQCSGDTCTCDSTELGSSKCVEACQLRPNFVDFTINHSTNTVTCDFATAEETAECTEMIGCCPNTGIATCIHSQDPNICLTGPHPAAGVPQTCFYKRP